MRPVFKSDEIPQSEGWGILCFLALIEFISYLILFANEGDIFPSLSIELLALLVKIPVYSTILVFCAIRFGRIDRLELVPNRRDALILLAALMIEFWVFGLLVGPERFKTPLHESIKDLSTGQYYIAILAIVVFIPLGEEIVFRRYFLEIQRQHYSTGISILLTATAGTLFHFEWSWPPLLWHFYQEAFLSSVYVKSRLGASVLVHAFINALVLFLSR